MATYKPYKKTESGKEEVQIPASSVSGLAKVATSGSYDDLSHKPDISGKLSKTENTGVNVLGTTKSTTTLGGNQLVAPNGIIFAGTAKDAGLVTRGICGVTTPDSNGACSKENLYINYDGNNDFNAGRQVVLNAGAVGNHLGSNMYQYAVPRGEIVKNWVEAKGYATSVKVNGNTIASSGGVIDIGTVITDVSGKANLSGGNTFSDLQTINAPTNVNGSEQTTMKVKTSNGGAIIFGKEGANSGTMIRLDQADGTCRLRFRSSATAGAMVWEQPESGAQLYVDLGARDGDYHRVEFPSGAGTLALTSQIPTVNNGTLKIQKNGTDVATFTANQSTNATANITVPTKVSELTNDSGYTTNTGTVTSVAVKMNNVTKGTVTSSGTIDLGTVLTEHQDISGKANLSGGNTFDSQQIFEDITGTTTINGSYVTIQPTGAQGAYSFEVLNSNNTTAFSVIGDSAGSIKVGSPVSLGNNFGTSGQVLTSQGAGETPTWTTPAIKSVSLSGTTLTITL